MKTIHRGPLYTISVERGADGLLEAVKTSVSGEKRREEYFPERDTSALAGETSELTAWQILRDVAAELAAGVRVPVEPAHIMIKGEGRFCLNPWSKSKDSAYTAPEGYEPVWALGASVFFLFLGCGVFQGCGGRYQGAGTPVPVMRRNAPELSALVRRCLSFKPSERPEVKEINEIACRAIERLERPETNVRPLKKSSTITRATPDTLDALWPEKMD
ncbi:MAG: hypothetical protein K2M06_02990 [Muribaculaceae bacterium]|nr:hypothetical protein [Muribaculaceae bacterium]